MGNKKVKLSNIWLLVKYLQFLPNFYETLWKKLHLESVILPEYELNWIKIMDFLLVANCLAFPIFYYPYFTIFGPLFDPPI